MAGKTGAVVALLPLLLHATDGLAIGGESDSGVELDLPTVRPSNGAVGLALGVAGGGRRPTLSGTASDDRAGSDMASRRLGLTDRRRPMDSSIPHAR